MSHHARSLALAMLLVLAGLTHSASALQPLALGSGEPSHTVLEGFESIMGHDDEGLSLSLTASYRPRLRLPDLGDRAFVLCWHTFLGRPEIPTDFSLAELGKQIDALLALGYRFISVEDLLFGRVQGSRNLVATLDDGHRTVLAAYQKVFAIRGIVPALFVYPSVIGSTNYSMDESQLRALRDSGCLIGAHGYHHLYVTEALYRSDRAMFEKEIFGAKTKVATQADFPVYVYAYPYGALSPITKAEVSRAGYAYAFSVKDGFVFADPRLNDPYELPRTVVTRDNWPQVYGFLQRNAATNETSSAEDSIGQ